MVQLKKSRKNTSKKTNSKTAVLESKVAKLEASVKSLTEGKKK